MHGKHGQCCAMSSRPCQRVASAQGYAKGERLCQGYMATPLRLQRCTWHMAKGNGAGAAMPCSTQAAHKFSTLDAPHGGRHTHVCTPTHAHAHTQRTAACLTELLFLGSSAPMLSLMQALLVWVAGLCPARAKLVVPSCPGRCFFKMLLITHTHKHASCA